MKSMCLLCGALVPALILPSTGAVLMTPVIPYRSIADSPYANQNLSPSAEEQPSNAYYEDFEELFDGLGSILVLGPGGELKTTPNPSGGGRNLSVDGDDGFVDGIARTGRGWSSSSLQQYPLMEFTFLPRVVTNDSPVWFGFAITYVNAPGPPAPFASILQIIGVDNTVLASIDLSYLEQQIRDIPTGPLHNGVLNDVFVSWQSTVPIKQVSLDGRRAMTIDHFQWGYNIPEPGSAALLLSAAALALRRKRRGDAGAERRSPV